MEDIHDIASLIDQESFWQAYGWLVMLAIALILLVSGLFILYRILQKPAEPESASPRQTALCALQKMAPHIQDGEDAVFADAVITILRRYIEDRFTVMPVDSPTEMQLADHPDVPKRTREQLKQMLNQCEPIRFGRGHFSVEAREAIYRMARTLIEADPEGQTPENKA